MSTFTVDRVHFAEAVYVGNEVHMMIPPVTDIEDAARRKAWTIEEVRGDIVVQYVYGGLRFASRVPASNIRTVVYTAQKVA